MAAWKAPEQKWTRGYYKLYRDSVLQAEGRRPRLPGRRKRQRSLPQKATDRIMCVK
jgi:hypothetical protein